MCDAGLAAPQPLDGLFHGLPKPAGSFSLISMGIGSDLMFANHMPEQMHGGSASSALRNGPLAASLVRRAHPDLFFLAVNTISIEKSMSNICHKALITWKQCDAFEENLNWCYKTD